MSGTVTFNPGSGGAVISTEDNGSGVQLPRTKLMTGASGTDGGNVATTNPLPVALQAMASGTGASIYRNLDTQSTGASVKASAGVVYGYYIFNAAASTRYVKLYDKATAPTVGTDTPKLTIPIAAGAGIHGQIGVGIGFALGIGIGAVTGIADANTTAPTANDVIVNLLYA